MQSVTWDTPTLCALCSVSDPNNVINGDLTDFAQISMPAGALGTAYISTEFTATETAGNYTGFVIKNTGGLLGSTLANTLTVTTYLAGAQQESKSGIDLTLHDEVDDKQTVEFATTQNFDEVRIDVSASASVTNEISVYWAFSSISSLPVELVSFEALVDGQGVTLTWETASETNNAGFRLQCTSRKGVNARMITWETLDFIVGSGTTLAPQQYSFHVAALPPGDYTFRLKQIDYDGTFAYSPEVNVVVDMAEQFIVEPAYPNPFNPEAHFSFAVQRSQPVRVELYDMSGRRVQVLYEELSQTGQMHQVRINGRDLSSGLYLIRLVGETFAETQTVTLLK